MDDLKFTGSHPAKREPEHNSESAFQLHAEHNSALLTSAIPRAPTVTIVPYSIDIQPQLDCGHVMDGVMEYDFNVFDLSTVFIEPPNSVMWVR